MFQVASHPAAFHLREHSRRPSYDRPHTPKHSSSASNAAIQLPRTLTRPPFTDISRDALSTAAPDLASVPTEFIRHHLLAKAPQMQAGLAALAPSHIAKSYPRAHLPPALIVPLRNVAGPPPSYPTHALAVGAPPPKGLREAPADAPQTIFAVHAVVLAAHCAKLPRLPPSHSGSGANATLPILPLILPSPQAFTLLHQFIYTHRIDTLLASLLPLPSPFLDSLTSSSVSGGPSAHQILTATLATPSVLHTLSAHLASASAGSLTTLMSHAAHVKELWQDMVALGVYDVVLWDALDLAWEVVLGGMNLAAGVGQ
ncbi:hypothetical protein R3P38DRAFT_3126514 [Favolaschia claudopus]|uniref:BTB domain-containing protein n=1 Tax=Favolaschia claudopus TaxID=2862362 RepID=A0AAV9ZA75_9AGAR